MTYGYKAVCRDAKKPVIMSLKKQYCVQMYAKLTHFNDVSTNMLHKF